MESGTPRRADTTARSDENAAYEAFLTLEGISPDDPRNTEHFTGSYVGSWETLEHFAAAIVASLGWAQALAEFTEVNAIPTQALRWDQQVLQAHLRETYDIVESSGYCHVFER